MILTAQDFKGLLKVPQDVNLDEYIVEFEKRGMIIVVGLVLANIIYDDYPSNPDYALLVDGDESYTGLRKGLAEFVFYNIVRHQTLFLNKSGIFAGTQDLADRMNAGLVISYHNSEFIRIADEVRDFISQNSSKYEGYDFSFDISFISENALGI